MRTYLPKPNHGKITPLWVITFFVSFSEGVLTLALTFSSGIVQFILTLFVTTFPVGVALGFFLILAFRHRNFYAPWEYPPNLTPQMFSEVGPIRIGADEGVRRQVLEESIKSSIADTQIANQVLNSIERTYLIIDPTPILGDDARSWQVPYEQFQTVQELIDSVWSAMAPFVPPYSYSERWVLEDANTHVRYDIGTKSRYVRARHLARDTRSLKEVGIRPGSRLEVVPPSLPSD